MKNFNSIIERENAIALEQKPAILEYINSQLANGKAAEYIDEHNGQVRTLQGYIILNDTHICPVIKNATAYCLNPLVLNEETGNIHLSRWSVGGTVMNMQYTFPEAAIIAYQKEAESDQFGFMKKITEYKLF